MCFWLCTTSELRKLELSRVSGVCEVSSKLPRQAWLQGHCQAWMLRNAGGMPGLNYSCKCISFLARKGLYLSVACCDQWFSLQCNWLPLSAKNMSGFGPVLSSHEEDILIQGFEYLVQCSSGYEEGGFTLRIEFASFKANIHCIWKTTLATCEALNCARCPVVPLR